MHERRDGKMEKFYVASSLQNKNAVVYVSNRLKSQGYLHTYDWTRNIGSAEHHSFTLDDLSEIGKQEKEGVAHSDFVVIMLPGGKGTHIELGIALGLGKKIFLYSEDGAINNSETTSTFYHLPEVEKCLGTLDELVKKILAYTES